MNELWLAQRDYLLEGVWLVGIFSSADKAKAACEVLKRHNDKPFEWWQDGIGNWYSNKGKLNQYAVELIAIDELQYEPQSEKKEVANG